MDRARSCANRCIFCFVDQMPPGMRETLYFKDDDARLSFLMGNYITLTNLSRRELQRIMDLHISPVNISVHATDPELRASLLKNHRRGNVCPSCEQFARAGITMNCQVVSCPGINDGPAWTAPCGSWAVSYPAVNSVAVVPVGVTRFREGLCPIAPYTPAQAAEVIGQVERFADAFTKGTRHSSGLVLGRVLPDCRAGPAGKGLLRGPGPARERCWDAAPAPGSGGAGPGGSGAGCGAVAFFHRHRNVRGTLFAGNR